MIKSTVQVKALNTPNLMHYLFDTIVIYQFDYLIIIN